MTRDPDATVVDPGAPRDAPAASDAQAHSSTLAMRPVPPPVPFDAARLGRYPVTGVLGRGGMGEVLSVVDPELGRTMAAKIARGQVGADVLAKFVLEAQVTGWLEHPGVPPVHELGTTGDGRVYFTMKRIDGQDLASVLDQVRAQRETPATRLPELLAVFVKVCETIAYAHSRGVIHRDLKPANVMVGAFGEVLVMDWGLARVLGRADACGPPSGAGPGRSTAGADGAPGGSARETQEGAILGTPAYMAPEQARGEIAALDERADVFALGAMLYEILCLEPPYVGPSVLSALALAIEGDVVPPSRRAPTREIPWELEAIVQRAMAPERDDRYANALELVADVRAYQEGRRVGAAVYGVRAALANWGARHRYLLRAAAAVLATGVVLVAVSAHRERSRRLVHEAAVAQARAALAAQAPAARLAEAAAEIALPPADPHQRYDSPSIEDGRRQAALLLRLQAAAEAHASLLALEPAQPKVDASLLAILLAIAHVAELAEDFTLAELTLARAGALDGGEEPAARARARLATARTAREDRRAAEGARLLDLAGRGALAEVQDLDRAAVEIAGHRGRATVDAMRMTLRALTDRLRAAATRKMLEARVPTAAEAEAGEAELLGLEEAVAAWHDAQVSPAPGCAAPPALSPAHEVVLGRAHARLEARASSASGDVRSPWRHLLSDAQRHELTVGGRRGDHELTLVCGALRLLGEPTGAVEDLWRYLWTEWDEVRAVPAGRALAALARRSPVARDALLDLVGLSVPRRRPGRWESNGPWWTQISREVARTRLATGTTPVPDGGRDLATADEYLQRGLVHLAAGEHAAALADFDRAIERDDRHAKAWSNRGLAHQALGDLDGAFADHTRAIEADPTLADAYNNRGTVSYAKSHLEAAVADFTRAIERDPRLARAYGNRGLAYASAGDYVRAAVDYDRAIELDPRDGRVLVHRGNALLTQGDLAAAIRDYSHAIELDPRLADAYSGRGNAKSAAGDMVGAIADHGRAVELDPLNACAYTNRGLVLYAVGDLAGAVRDHTRAIELDPRLAGAFNNRALALTSLRDFDGAIRDFTTAIGLAPHRASYYDGRGRARRDSGDLAGAKADCDRALEEDPRYARGYAGRALALLALGDSSGALRDCTQAIELDARDAEYPALRGRVLRARGDLDGALRDADRAIELAPRVSIHHFDRGNVREGQGDLAGAAIDYTRALELDPNNVAARFNRGRARQGLGDHGAAIEDFSRVVELAPRDAAAWSLRGVSHHLMGELEAGLRDHDRALELDPRSATSYVNRALARGASGDDDGAIADLERAVELDPALWQAHANLGSVWARRGRRELALAALRRALEHAPADARASLEGRLREVESLPK